MVAAACVSFLAPCRAAAQGLPGSIEIGGGAGRFYGGTFAAGSTRLTEKKADADDNILRGFWLAAHLTHEWNVEIAVRRTATDLIQSEGGMFASKARIAGLDFASIELLGLRTWRHGRFAPYAGLGIGVAILAPNQDVPAVRDTNRAAVSLGGGARFYAVPRAGIRIDFRARATYLGKRAQEDRGWNDSGRWFVNEEILGGIFLSFGGR
jgi:hypothetical protein